jgi:hypothetical protein
MLLLAEMKVVEAVECGLSEPVSTAKRVFLPGGLHGQLWLRDHRPW